MYELAQLLVAKDMPFEILVCDNLQYSPALGWRKPMEKITDVEGQEVRLSMAEASLPLIGRHTVRK